VIKKRQEISLDAFTYITSVKVTEFRTTEVYSKGDPSEIKIKYHKTDKKKGKSYGPNKT
jgi:hypothetical protein